jgi:hypothetical protein
MDIINKIDGVVNEASADDIRYYKGQLAGLKTDAEFPVKVQFASPEGGKDTKWLSLNSNSAKVIIDFLSNLKFNKINNEEE